MPDCIICYEGGGNRFNPQVRHTACVCKYDIHPNCYKTWLNASEDLAFHCVICRKKLSTAEARDQVFRIHNNWERTLRYSLAIFFIVINLYKLLIALLIFAVIVIYVKKVIDIRAQRVRY